MRTLTLAVLSLAFAIPSAVAAEKPAPLKALLVLGGCCHDYAAQKDILKAGLEKRANVKVDLAYSSDTGRTPPLPIFGNPGYAKGYDVVIHDECSAGIEDPAIIQAVLAPHRAGTPGVNLHCAVHSFRVGPPATPAPAGSDRAAWFEYLGVQSSRHGPKLPITVEFTGQSPIVRGMSAWTTGNEELYNNIEVLPKTTVLARGKQTVKDKVEDAAVVWTNDYRGTRVFTTSLGHTNETVSDGRYLDLVTRGMLWACKKLDDAGKPLPGYGPSVTK